MDALRAVSYHHGQAHQNQTVRLVKAATPPADEECPQNAGVHVTAEHEVKSKRELELSCRLTGNRSWSKVVIGGISRIDTLFVVGQPQTFQLLQVAWHASLQCEILVFWLVGVIILQIMNKCRRLFGVGGTNIVGNKPWSHLFTVHKSSHWPQHQV
jgi:hypothetical protein